MTADMFTSNGGAQIDVTGTYRYLLWRGINGDSAGTMTFVMLNPSTADATVDDPTIRRCISFAERERMTRLEVVNLFAYRATDPKELPPNEFVVGLENVKYVTDSIEAASVVVAAWGASVPQKLALYANEMIRHVCEISGERLYCLGELTKGGHPRHPLYLRSDTELQRFAIPSRNDS